MHEVKLYISALYGQMYVHILSHGHTLLVFFMVCSEAAASSDIFIQWCASSFVAAVWGRLSCFNMITQRNGSIIIILYFLKERDFL